MCKLTINPVNQYGVIWFNFHVRKGSLLLTSIGSEPQYVAQPKYAEHYVLESSEVLQGKSGEYYSAFRHFGRGVWHKVDIPLQSFEGRMLQRYLDYGTKEIHATRHLRTREEAAYYHRYDGTSESAPRLRNVNYRFNARHMRPESDNADKPSGTVNPECWAATYKNDPQVGYKRAGTPVKAGAKKQSASEAANRTSLHAYKAAYGTL